MFALGLCQSFKFILDSSVFDSYNKSKVATKVTIILIFDNGSYYYNAKNCKAINRNRNKKH